MNKVIVCFLTLILWGCAQKPEGSTSAKAERSIPVVLERVAPPNWWVGMKNQELQLMVKHPNIAEYFPSVAHKGVSLLSFDKGDSPNYVFLNLKISAAALPGELLLRFKHGDGRVLESTYVLKSRNDEERSYRGFNTKDAIYLITPDRFANANPENDSLKTLREQGIDRENAYKRHGGDIEGIIRSLDYIQDMGFTAVWPSPLLTNDMKESSYHGYAITDYYQVDPRFGTLDTYKALSSALRKRGMKLIMDQVANHCGLNHWWMSDLPFRNWINDQENFEKHRSEWNGETVLLTNHRRTVNQDPYASKHDQLLNEEGWFVATMPDLNQRNPFLAKYLIQNSIWWVETLHLGGIRQDTYPYPNKDFMSQWAKAIMREYPNFSIVGEEWSYNPLLIAYWQSGAKNKDGYESNLPSTMDFAMQRTIVQALMEEEAWDKGLVKLYEGLANDFAYANPKAIMCFLDNHDMSRIHTQLKGSVAKTKMALSYLLVLPRIPQIYYGTEILMDDFDKPGDHGLIRSDFPGGWQGDKKNAFTGVGLSKQQKEMQLFVKKLLQYRKNSEAIAEGETVHFAPHDGVYVLFRIAKEELVMHVINKNTTAKELSLDRFKELNLEGRRFRNILTEEEGQWSTQLKVPANSSVILTTKLN